MNKKIIFLVLSTLFAVSAWAQKLSIGYLYPAGGEMGQTVEIEAGGLNINKATKVLFNHPGISGVVFPVKESAAEKKKKRKLNDQSSPQLADKVKIKITIAPNVPCGLYDLRLQSPKGISNMLPFEVAPYPDFKESGKSTLRKPDIVAELPAVLCGYVTPGGVDYFRFSGSKGDKIVASVKARTLVPYIADAVPGWFQPVIKIVDSRGKEIAYSDDYFHNVDPVIITELPKDGDYTLMIHDAIYRGRQDFNYRIQLGVIPFVTGRYPAYGVVGKKTKQNLEGVNIDAAKVTVTTKKEGYNQLAYTGKNGTSNTVSFYALPKGVKLLQYPETGASLELNSAISDSLTLQSKVKRYKIAAQRGQRIFVELIGRRNGSRIDALMRLLDASGNVVAEVDDTEDPTQGLMTFHADPVIKYMARSDEEMTLEVEDLHRGHGKDYHYLLRRHIQMPSFNAFVSPANISVPAGGTATFRVDIKGGLRRPAKLEIEGLPKGFKTSSMRVDHNKKWEVSITAPKNAAARSFPIELKLKYTTRRGEGCADVQPADNMMQAFYYVHHIPAAQLSVEILKPSPYRMSLDLNLEKELTFDLTDEKIPIKVRVEKNAGFEEVIALSLGRKNKMFSLDPIEILPEETEKTIYIKLNSAALAKFRYAEETPTWQMNIVGTVKGEIIKQGRRSFQNAKYSEMTPLFMLKIKDRY